MKMQFYKIQDERNRIDKTISDPLELDGTLRDSTNIWNPEIMVRADEVKEYNYCYIESFHRFYFIESMQQHRNQIVLIRLTEDVLMTYKTQIENLTGIVSRVNKDSYIPGNEVIDSRKNFEVIKWDKSLELGSKLLIAYGG